MADLAGEGDSVVELAAARALGEAEEGFGYEACGKDGCGGRVGEVDGGSGVLVDNKAESATSNGVADVLPRDGVGDGDVLLGDGREELGLGELDEKARGDRKVEEGDAFPKGVLVVGRRTGHDVAGGEVKFNEEKGGVEMEVNEKEFVKGSTGVASSNTIEDRSSNPGIASENMEWSVEKEITSVSADEDRAMNDVSAIMNVEAKETCWLDENADNLGEGNKYNFEKACTDVVNDELGTAPDAIYGHKSNVEFVCGNIENDASVTSAVTSGVTASGGGPEVCKRNVSGNSEADQLVDNNGKAQHSRNLITDNSEINPDESEMQLTRNVDIEIDGKANEMCTDPSSGGIEAMENHRPWSEEDTADIGCAVSNSATMEVDEASAPNNDGSGVDDVMAVDEQYDNVENLEMIDEKEDTEGELKTESCRGIDEAVYQLPPEPEDMFAVSNLVWGKVRSHPWWPGQIFNQSDASEKAMKYHKEDSFLVAYFGDHTFAWNEASSVKPFLSYFSNAVKQSIAEGFQNAVDCALEEVSRRVELGLTCSCLSEDVLDEIKVQEVENAGIEPDSCRREGVDKSMDANTLKPNAFLKYLRRLALSPLSGADRLELMIAKAQLLAFYRHKGFNQLPEFQSFGDLEEVDAEALDSKDSIQADDAKDMMAASCQGSVWIPKGSAHRRKHNLKDVVYHRRKERSLFELMDEAMMYSEDDEFELDGTLLAKRHRGLNKSDESDFPDGRKIINAGKFVSPLPKPSFKVGECISRVASQMTRSPSMKTQSEEVEHVEHAAVNEDAEKVNTGIAAEGVLLEDLLSQLQSAAVSPLGRYSFSSASTRVFSDFRNLIAVGLDLSVGRIGGKRKRSSQHASGSSEPFAFEDKKDVYWTDKIVGNGFEGNLNGENQRCSSEQEKPRRAGRRPYTRRRVVEVSESLPEKPVRYVDPNSPAELVLTFPEPTRFIPSEVSLNKTFKRFGTLNELQTELDRDGNRARVVFKKCRDAEVAYNSVTKFNIFGSLVVNYQLNHALSEPFTTYYKPDPFPEAPEDAKQRFPRKCIAHTSWMIGAQFCH